MDTFSLIFELMGTVAFAVSGAMTGLKKQMDLFGVAILGLTTAVGGGILRDVILGIHPPKMFQNPSYALLAIFVAVIVFIPLVRRRLTKNVRVYDQSLLWMDSLGLGIFTVVGIATACEFAQGNLFLLVFAGVLTGVGGGVMRDVMAGVTPYIFVKHIYACASLVGAVLCALLWAVIGQYAAMLLGMLSVVTLRVLAAHFRWNLPRAKGIGA